MSSIDTTGCLWPFNWPINDSPYIFSGFHTLIYTSNPLERRWPPKPWIYFSCLTPFVWCSEKLRISIRFSKLYILIVWSKEHLMMHGGLRISTISVISYLCMFIASPTRGLRTNGLKFQTLSLKSFMPDVTNCLECYRHQMRSWILSVCIDFQYSRRVLI